MTTYKKVTDVEHILLRPDTYVGSKEPRTGMEYVLSGDTAGLTVACKELTTSPAIERTFTEILSNAVDNALRYTLDPDATELRTKAIKVKMDLDSGEISVWNDGAYIPITVDNTEGIYNHSLIFGHLRSSSNYDDTKVRYVSGRNGFGSKLTNVFSSKFEVTGVDPERKLQLKQVWTNNMRTTVGVKVTKATTKTGSTMVRWTLDWSQFRSIDRYSSDYMDLFRFHALTAAISTGVSVYFNDVKLPNTLTKFVELVYKEPRFLKVTTKDTTAIICPSSGDHEQVSFVNGIRTRTGGKHVDTWMQTLCKALLGKLGSGGSTNLTIKEVKQYLRVMVISTVPNPEFDSQEKNRLCAPGVETPAFTDAMLSRILNTWGLKKVIMDTHVAREDKKALKAITTNTPNRIVPGYDKANNCDNAKLSSKCTLFICEGLSAKTFAVAGLTHGMKVSPTDPHRQGRDWFGIYPLRGKILNVRKVGIPLLAKNEVICNLMYILGISLEPARQRAPKYGHVCILTDADTDGTHIKGLLINFFAMYFPSVMRTVVSMNTPILKVNNRYIYDERSDKDKLLSGHKIKSTKYYKGLGTTEKKDMKEIFGAKMTLYDTAKDTEENLVLAFGKGETQARKDWIEQYRPHQVRTDTIDFHAGQFYTQRVSDFVKDDLISFARDDCVRSLPSLMDGLKESQRKVLYAAKKKNFIQEYKVTQFAGYVSENSEYHHGEQNLLDTIIRMAQDFPGSNNCPIFMSEASFGSRLEGGKDAAQGRYLMTKLRPYVNLLYPSEDDTLLRYRQEGTTSIEPYYYVPIVPTILLNGCKGIGTGWSCTIPTFSVEDVISNTRRWARKEPLEPMVPSCPGFMGTVTPVKDNSLSDHDVSFEIKGSYSVEGNVITVTELPIGLWTSKFIMWCQQQPNLSYNNYSTVDTVRVELTTTPESQRQTMIDLDKVLTLTIHLRNMVTFTSADVIQRVTLQDIFDQWGQERWTLYETRKAHLMTKLKDEIQTKTLTMNLIQLVRSNKVNICDSEAKIQESLVGYPKGALEHLMSLSVRSFTAEKVAALSASVDSLKREADLLQGTSIEQLWMKDLDRLVKALRE